MSIQTRRHLALHRAEGLKKTNTPTPCAPELAVASSRRQPDGRPRRDRHDARDVIPNQVHFVYVLPKNTPDFSFEFSHFLSIYAAWHYWRPHTIYLHTNVPATGDEVARARNGTAGKWNKHIFSKLFDVQINTVTVPTHAGNGKELKNMEHRSDFVRVKAVHDLGGVYIDWDVHALRDIAPLREAGFKAVAGRQRGGEVNSGTFLSVRGGRMVALWMRQMHTAYTGAWTAHSNAVLTRVAQRLVAAPAPAREMLIMERDAFAPGSWVAHDTDALFAVHNTTVSNLQRADAAAVAGGPATARPVLPAYEEAFAARWDTPELFEDWERDWSATYLLHAFTPVRWSHEVDGFTHITPRYVLARQSNFARAVYPVARLMHERGLIEVEDSHTGR
ncbi:hypothetical protein BT67DRAFT_452791 [Trichocladium antarcticum]|uniref:Glycosyl transferase n=1 Tax=Trichocladium antarcticum TaxID=1450529 RepID=A0AAN6UC02_9PEZI|nr:hypothetical protein BT67DRAFT_452791 [Trichocladium antarcticum]